MSDSDKRDKNSAYIRRQLAHARRKRRDAKAKAFGRD